MFPSGPDPTAPPMPTGPAAWLPTLSQFGPAEPGESRAAHRDHDRPPRRGPDGALARLVEGNARFVAGSPRYGHSVAAARAVAAEPAPFAAIIGCIDSRLPVEAIFDQDFGAVCAVRSAAHVLDRASLASVEFATGVLGVDLVVVLGHGGCLAVSAAVHARRTGRRPLGHLGYVVDEIGSAIHDNDLGHADVDELITRRYTGRSVARLRGLLGTSGARVVGAYYDVRTGVVELPARSDAP